MKKAFIIICFTFIVSCSFATQEKFERAVNAWVGQPEQSLIDKLGPPEGVYELNGKKYLTWTNSSTSYVPQTVHNSTIGNNVQTNVYGGYYRSWYCKVTYIVEKEIIVSWRYDGNACVAK